MKERVVLLNFLPRASSLVYPTSWLIPHYDSEPSETIAAASKQQHRHNIKTEKLDDATRLASNFSWNSTSPMKSLHHLIDALKYLRNPETIQELSRNYPETI